MARMRVLKVGVLNIKTQPHSPEKYTNLFMKTHSISIPGKIRGSDWGMIGTLRETKKSRNNEYKIVFGTIYRFLNIDPRGDWLDLKKRKPINAEEEGSVPLVPDYLKPNLKQIFYMFYPEHHRLFFERKAITPKGMRSLLLGLFAVDEVYQEFGKVDIEIESTKEAIKKILSIPRITKLAIDFSFPNPDDLSEATQKVLKRFKKQNIRRHKQVSTTTHDDGIQPDDETKSLMDVARSNGKVTATGYDGDMKIIRSTVDHPYVSQAEYDPESETLFDAMLLASTGMLNSIR